MRAQIIARVRLRDGRARVRVRRHSRGLGVGSFVRSFSLFVCHTHDYAHDYARAIENASRLE